MPSLLQFTAVTLVGAVLLRTLVVWLPGQDVDESPPPSADDVLRDVPFDPKSVEYAEYFQRDVPITQVVDGVYFAFGKSYVNSIIVDAPEGLIVVDTTESRGTAADIYRQLRQITDKPIKAIIYTHSHVDHIQGSQEFVDDPSNLPDIWAFHAVIDAMHENMPVARRMSVTAAYQFGVLLGAWKYFARVPQGLKFCPTLKPNRLIRDEIEHAVIAGLNVTFIHVPGETDDHIAVWLEDKKVLMPGDNVYRSFPNIYAIRGTPTRDAQVWAASIRKLRSLQAEYLLPSHTDPVSGREEIDKLLAVYAAAIQYVHDQTVRRMNELRHPDEIARMVRLPPDLASHPYLGEFYGKVEWSSKAVYQRYVGWFSGDPVDLLPLTPSERSQKMVELVGVDRLLDEAESSLKAGDTQWALELSSHVFRVQPDNRRAKDLRVQALRVGAANSFNTCARNYYLTSALEAFGLVNVKVDPQAIIENTPVKVLLNVMKVRLKAELTHGRKISVILHFDDSNTTFNLFVEYSVLTVDEVTSSDDKLKTKDGEDSLLVTTTERVWKAVMFGLLPPATAYNHGELKVTPANRLDDLRLFLSYF